MQPFSKVFNTTYLETVKLALAWAMAISTSLIISSKFSMASVRLFISDANSLVALENLSTCRSNKGYFTNLDLGTSK